MQRPLTGCVACQRQAALILVEYREGKIAFDTVERRFLPSSPGGKQELRIASLGKRACQADRCGNFLAIVESYVSDDVKSPVARHCSVRVFILGEEPEQGCAEAGSLRGLECRTAG